MSKEEKKKEENQNESSTNIKENETKIVKEKETKRKSKKGITIIVIIILAIILALIVTNKKGVTETSIKSTLKDLVETSKLQTATVTYNVIAKECKDNNKNCDKKSNNAKDYKYVVSCEGKVTTEINFDDIDVNVDNASKKVIIKIPKATIDTEKGISVPNLTYLNGNKVSTSELPNAMKLCINTIKDKLNSDDKILEASDEQATKVIKEFYKDWAKRNGYYVEVKQ